MLIAAKALLESPLIQILIIALIVGVWVAARE